MAWMAWTPITATFFICVALLLVGMSIAELLCPTSERRGFLPIVTTRGDRLFIGLLSSAYIHLSWLVVTSLPLWIATLVSVAFVAALMRWG